MKTARITSSASFLPGEPIGNDDLERLVGPLPEDILEGIQVKRRHWMIDPATGSHTTSNSAMAAEAATRALDAAGLGAGDVDLIVTSTASPEYHLPPMVTLVQDRLGLKSCATMEIRSGCAGFVEALDVARLYVERGTYATALVIGSESISPLLVPVFLGKDPDRIRMRDRMNPYNFGDGAGAVVVQAANGETGGEGDGIIGAAMACLGGQKAPGMEVIGGAHARAAPRADRGEAARRAEGRRRRVRTLHAARSHRGADGGARRERVSAEDIDLCVIPEGNAGYMVEELKEAGLLTPEWIALEGKIYENLTEVGATGSAAVPLALDDAWRKGRLKPGDRVMLLAIETSKWKYAGMVLTWTAAAPAEQAEAFARAQTA